MTVHGVAPIPLVVSSWLNFALYTIEIILCGLYLSRPSRPTVSRIAICVLVLADTFCTLSINFEVGLVLASKTEDFHFVQALAAKIVTTYTSAVITQLFFCNLYRILTRNNIVSGVLACLSLAHLGLSWSTAILLMQKPHVGPASGMAFTLSIVAAGTCATTDVGIAVLLGRKLWKMMQGTMPGYDTRSLLCRILLLSVGSGGVCAINTLIMMILLAKNNPALTFLFALQGRFYGISILANLLLGIPGRPPHHTEWSAHGSHTERGTAVSSVVFDLGRIRVPPNTQVTTTTTASSISHTTKMAPSAEPLEVEELHELELRKDPEL
ncbi:hypothetical protein C8R46DRAFT_1072250 [Mycena filopes]|nr:hypothetical protein C8R46DRAFT_1072250 [Mycena filopes]